MSNPTLQKKKKKKKKKHKKKKKKKKKEKNKKKKKNDTIRNASKRYFIQRGDIMQNTQDKFIPIKR